MRANVERHPLNAIKRAVRGASRGRSLDLVRAEQEVVLMRRAWIMFAQTGDDAWRRRALGHLRDSILDRRAHREGQRRWREQGVPVKVNNEYCVREAERLAPGAVHAGRRGVMIGSFRLVCEITTDDVGAERFVVRPAR